jgi:hypothetical protein
VKRLTVFCEGATERGFCNQLLRPHLFPNFEAFLHTIEIAHSKHRRKVSRGGVPAHYETMRRDITNGLKARKQETDFFTTLIDVYGLPNDFPGKDQNVRNPANPTLYVEALETAFGDDIGDRRFIPYLQLHEYESMLFANPEALQSSFPGCDQAIEQLTNIAASVPSIEHIDDGTATAPSKRIIGVLPAYEGRKSSAGPDVAEYIGLATIRSKCPHFDKWLTRLEGLWH